MQKRLNIAQMPHYCKTLVRRSVLFHDDCFNIFPHIESKSVDLILCDLPYGTTACKWDSILPFDKLWEQYERIIKPNGAIVLFGSQPFTSALIMSNPKLFKYEWIWNKISGSNFMNLKNRPFKTQENICVFSKSSNFTFNPIFTVRTEKSLKRYPKEKVAIINKQGLECEHYKTNTLKQNILKKNGEKHPIDIITFSNVEKDRYKIKHPTKKPVLLMEYLVKTYTNENDIVLDNCMGSGTTGVACDRLNRQFIGIEKEKAYYDISVKRLSETLF
jgi:site-specific DNA-methyltransferase (adenine-specific)